VQLELGDVQDWRCPHTAGPDGQRLVVVLGRHDIDARSMPCPEVHAFAQYLGRVNYIAMAERKLCEECEFPPAPAVHYEPRSLRIALAVGLPTLAALIFVFVSLGRILWPW
jgi:hypothetical protein